MCFFFLLFFFLLTHLCMCVYMCARAVQWEQNDGNCGVCGDPYQMVEPRPHEAGGEYAKGIISRFYTAGQVCKNSNKHISWLQRVFVCLWYFFVSFLLSLLICSDIINISSEMCASHLYELWDVGYIFLSQNSTLFMIILKLFLFFIFCIVVFFFALFVDRAYDFCWHSTPSIIELIDVCMDEICDYHTRPMQIHSISWHNRLVSLNAV